MEDNAGKDNKIKCPIPQKRQLQIMQIIEPNNSASKYCMHNNNAASTVATVARLTWQQSMLDGWIMIPCRPAFKICSTAQWSQSYEHTPKFIYFLRKILPNEKTLGKHSLTILQALLKDAYCTQTHISRSIIKLHIYLLFWTHCAGWQRGSSIKIATTSTYVCTTHKHTLTHMHTFANASMRVCVCVCSCEWAAAAASL